MNSVTKMVLVPYDKYQRLLNKEPVKASVTEEDSLATDLILAGTPKSYKNKVTALLTYVEQSPDISWNHAGELVFRREPIIGSHITDLLRYCMRDYGKQEPAGAVEFYQVLADANIPRCLIGNQTVLHKLVRTDKQPLKQWLSL